MQLFTKFEQIAEFFFNLFFGPLRGQLWVLQQGQHFSPQMLCIKGLYLSNLFSAGLRFCIRMLDAEENIIFEEMVILKGFGDVFRDGLRFFMDLIEFLVVVLIGFDFFFEFL